MKQSEDNESNPTLPGYWGIWFDLGQESEYGSKYSGGLGTYTAKHRPMAVYAPEVEKTFFVYGGTRHPSEKYLLAMVSYFDHRSGRVPRPRIVHDKEGVLDPHDNPSIQIDEGGTIWVFVSGRGQLRPGFIYRSRRPYSIDAFESIYTGEFTYPQPWWIRGSGFLHLFTRYTDGRELYWNESDLTGRKWSHAKKLAGMGGHYQLSSQRNGEVVTAFNMHPEGDVDRRTNLYVLKTSDGGSSWTTMDGETAELPLLRPDGTGLIRNYQREGRLVYLKDMHFDAEGHPVILYLTSNGYQAGPEGDPRIWTLARWTGSDWVFHEITHSSHNYDMGSLYIEEGEPWRILAPTAPGPQYHGTGGEMVLWTSTDQGRTWNQARQVTSGSVYNHAYARRPIPAHPDFYAFWADGNPDAFSESRLYFTKKSGEQVWQLPTHMEAGTEEPRPCD